MIAEGWRWSQSFLTPPLWW